MNILDKLFCILGLHEWWENSYPNGKKLRIPSEPNLFRWCSSCRKEQTFEEFIRRI